MSLQVVENAPYVTHLDIMDKYNCDFCAHGGIYACTKPHIILLSRHSSLFKRMCWVGLTHSLVYWASLQKVRYWTTHPANCLLTQQIAYVLFHTS